MTGFEPWTSGNGSDCSSNWATTTSPALQFVYDIGALTKAVYLSFLPITSSIYIMFENGLLGQGDLQNGVKFDEIPFDVSTL